MPSYPRPPSRLPIYLWRSIAISAVMVYLLRKELFGEELIYAYGVQPKLYLWLFGLGGSAYFLRWWYRGEVQRYLNSMAVCVLSSPTAAPYWLYLRPFSLDATLPQKNPNFAGPLGFLSFDSRMRDFEELIREAVQREGGLCLVGLGPPEGIVGAGRLMTSDSEWVETFESLARYARRILVIPAGGSVRVEVEFLAIQGFLGKTIFLKPPTTQPRLTLRSAFKPDDRLAFGPDQWEGAIQEMTQVGLRLPTYRKQTAFLLLDSSGEPAKEAVVCSNKPRVLRNGLRWVSEDPLV